MLKAAVIFILFAYAPAPLSAQSTKGRPITDSEIDLVIQAIRDEIYDYGYQGKFADIGENLNGKGSRVPVYFEPNLRGDEGWIIYKLMPYGEVHRSFHLAKDGLAVLDGDPEVGFPPSQPSSLTIYTDDEKICRAKQRSTKRYFDVLFLPTPATVQEASQRQKQRVGFSVHESESPKPK